MRTRFVPVPDHDFHSFDRLLGSSCQLSLRHISPSPLPSCTESNETHVGRPRLDPRPKNGIHSLDDGDDDGAAETTTKELSLRLLLVVIVICPIGATSGPTSDHGHQELLLLLTAFCLFVAHGSSPSLLLGHGICSWSRIGPSE